MLPLSIKSMRSAIKNAARQLVRDHNDVMWNAPLEFQNQFVDTCRDDGSVQPRARLKTGFSGSIAARGPRRRVSSCRR